MCPACRHTSPHYPLTTNRITNRFNQPNRQVLACDVSGMLSIFSVRTGRLMVTKQLTAGNGFSRGGLFTLSAQATAPAGGGGGARGPGSSSLANASAAGGAITGGVVSICGVMRRQLYAVVTGHELSLWHVEHELDYNVARGGHDKAVIALYSCSGGVVGRVMMVAAWDGTGRVDALLRCTAAGEEWCVGAGRGGWRDGTHTGLHLSPRPA